MLKINYYKDFFLIFAVILSVLAIEKSSLAWKSSHLIFDYHFGFIKRGIIGEILSLFSPFVIIKSVHAFAYLQLATLAILLLNHIRKSLFPLSLLLLCSPFGFRNLIFDWGRFDQIGYIFILVLFGSRNWKTSFEILLFASPFLILVHEAMIIWLFPLIMIVAIHKKITDEKILVWLTISLIFTLLVVFWGKANVEIDTMLSYLNSRSEYPIKERPVLILYRSLIDNIQLTFLGLSQKIVDTRFLWYVFLWGDIVKFSGSFF